MRRWSLLLALVVPLAVWSVELGIDGLFNHPIIKEMEGKKIGLITNHTGINSKFESTISLLSHHQSIELVALFSPEHGLEGVQYAGENVASKNKEMIPIHSLHGSTRRPTKEMLKGLDYLVYDIQDGGIRPYTYASTLYYAMEEAAKYNLPVVVLDRPNPLSGQIVDGPMLDEKNYRTFLGYINVPYCHGMTIGELATFFNKEYKVGCHLTVVKMQGYSRSMSFLDTNAPWIPTSPNVPEPDSALFMATTGMLGELGIVSIGIGYTLPFKVVGAPWINAHQFALHLNQQKLKGVKFVPFHFRPFSGVHKGEECHGILIKVTQVSDYKPLEVGLLITGVLKSLYPYKVNQKLANATPVKKEFFCKATGSKDILNILEKESVCAWKLIDMCRVQSQSFLKKRFEYLFPEYE